MTKQDLIVQTVLSDIDKGLLKQGDRLPTLAELQEQHRCSYGTVRSAVLILKAQKWVRGEQGIGLFVQEQEDL